MIGGKLLMARMIDTKFMLSATFIVDVGRCQYKCLKDKEIQVNPASRESKPTLLLPHFLDITHSKLLAAQERKLQLLAQDKGNNATGAASEWGHSCTLGSGKAFASFFLTSIYHALMVLTKSRRPNFIFFQESAMTSTQMCPDVSDELKSRVMVSILVLVSRMRMAPSSSSSTCLCQNTSTLRVATVSLSPTVCDLLSHLRSICHCDL